MNRIYKKLTFERLEDRQNPSISGTPWPDARHLTISFAGDGADVGGNRNVLFETFNQFAAPEVWQQEIVRAFQTWAVHANINIGVVNDGHLEFGATGLVQGDSRFGDIRIAAISLPDGTLATNTPFQWTGTTWSGDIIFNSNYRFDIIGGPVLYSLFAATLNEAGNVLGVLDTDIQPTSAVYSQYVDNRTGLNKTDITDIQLLYGVRAPDRFETLLFGNGSFLTATQLTNNPVSLNFEADITAQNDQDYYRVTVPLLKQNVRGLRVTVSTNGLSALTPEVIVYNSARRVVASQVSTYPLHGELTIDIERVSAGSSYYICVRGQADTVFDIGSYRLGVSYRLADGTYSPNVDPLSDLLDGHTNDLILTAESLLSLGTAKSNAQFDAFASGMIEDGTDVDFYRIQAPNLGLTSQKLNVIVWPKGDSPLNPKVDVFDFLYRPIAANLIANENGTFSIEIPNVHSLLNYYVKIGAQAASGPYAIGQYEVGLDFTSTPITSFNNYVNESMVIGSSTSYSFQVGQNQLLQFMLAMDSRSLDEQAGAMMQIVDSTGKVVFVLNSKSGSLPVTGHNFLKAGVYRVVFSTSHWSATGINNIAIRLDARTISDPIGPRREQGTTAVPTPNKWEKEAGSSSSNGSVGEKPYYG